MEDNKKLELNEDVLAKVAGGAFGDWETCSVCGKPKREGYLCIHCEMADGVVTCHKCRAKLYKETGCVNCGTTWDEYVRITEPLRVK